MIPVSASGYSRLDNDGRMIDSEKTPLTQPEYDVDEHRCKCCGWGKKSFLFVCIVAVISTFYYSYNFGKKAHNQVNEDGLNRDEVVLIPDTGIQVPENCQVWFDGCNTCHRVKPGSEFGCTKMFCPQDQLKEPFCKKKFPTDENKDKENCKVWFDGCNTCSREDPGAVFACTEMFCANGDMKEPFCELQFLFPADSENSDDDSEKDCKVWFDGCNMCNRDKPDSQFACTMKYCPPDQLEKPFCKQKFPMVSETEEKSVAKVPESPGEGSGKDNVVRKHLNNNKHWCANSKPQRCRRLCTNEPVCSTEQCLMREDFCCKFSCQDL